MREPARGIRDRRGRHPRGEPCTRVPGRCRTAREVRDRDRHGGPHPGWPGERAARSLAPPELCAASPSLTSDRRLRHSAAVSWREAVGGRLATPAEALRRVRPGDTVAVAPYTSTPLTLCPALHAPRPDLSCVRLRHRSGHVPWGERGAAG